MAVPEICLGRFGGGGAGGAAGGGGPTGPGSNVGGGVAVSGTGWPTINIVSDSKQILDIVLYDNLCSRNPQDISEFSKIEFVAKERHGSVEDYLRKKVSIIDATNGRVRLKLKPKDLKYSGMWLAGFVCYDDTSSESEEPVAQFPCYLSITRSLNSPLLDINAPLSIPEVRLALRDVCPSFNSLLEDVEFSDTEIAFAITRPVDEWNDTPPDVKLYSYSTFEYRSAWLKATIGYLLSSAAYHYARNRLPYSAGGVNIDDMDKATPYAGLANQLLGEWRTFMMTKKKEININLCYGMVGSRSFR